MASTFQQTNRGIKNGPSKYDLMTALFSGTPVEFSIETAPGSGFAPRKKAHVLSVEAEDGSMESWNIVLSIDGTRDNHKIYYSSKNRTGVVTVEKIF